jgi:hypothetical protein
MEFAFASVAVNVKTSIVLYDPYADPLRSWHKPTFACFVFVFGFLMACVVHVLIGNALTSGSSVARIAPEVGLWNPRHHVSHSYSSCMLNELVPACFP